MDYPNIKKHLGEDWLKNQLEKIEKKDWTEESIPKDQLIKKVSFSILE